MVSQETQNYSKLTIAQQGKLSSRGARKLTTDTKKIN